MFYADIGPRPRKFASLVIASTRIKAVTCGRKPLAPSPDRAATDNTQPADCCIGASMPKKLPADLLSDTFLPSCRVQVVPSGSTDVVVPRMRWFRTKRSFCGALALFALALQITLSFGHIHRRDFAGIPGAPVAHAQLTAAHSPDGDAADQLSDGYCLVCAAVALSGTAVLPVLPALLPPAPLDDVSHWYRLADARGRFDHALFSARAPPLV